jgi:hypothetical protein
VAPFAAAAQERTALEIARSSHVAERSGLPHVAERSGRPPGQSHSNSAAHASTRSATLEHRGNRRSSDRSEQTAASGKEKSVKPKAPPGQARSSAVGAKQAPPGQQAKSSAAPDGNVPADEQAAPEASAPPADSASDGRDQGQQSHPEHPSHLEHPAHPD